MKDSLLILSVAPDSSNSFSRECLLVVAAALIDSDERLLVQRRPQTGHMPGLWEFPGGKAESGETPEEALVRELNEELGIKVAHESLSPACFASEPLSNRHLLLLLYIVRQWEGVAIAHHAEALQWMRLAELHDLLMPPADKPLIASLELLL